MSDLTCAKCGLANASGEPFCRKCGASLGAPERSEPEAKHVSIKEDSNDGNLWMAVIAGTFVATLFGLGGFASFKSDNGAMGGVLFLLLPAAAGFTIAVITRRPNVVRASLILALLFCFTFLLVLGLEGIVCVMMASPIIALGLGLGALLGSLFRRKVVDKSPSPGGLKFITLMVVPIVLIGGDRAERPFRESPRTETFTITRKFDAPPAYVWNMLKGVESISAPKPFLLRIGLPVPVSCSLESESVGSKRTCYFNSGYIEERVTGWDPPNSMQLEVVHATLPGRHWLGFKEAAYDLKPEGGGTLVTRRTTITSRLYPAWYWRNLEGLGVDAEHRYLMDELTSRIERDKQH